MSDWRRLADVEAVRTAATASIEQAAATAIAAHGDFRLVLAGGSTPRTIYRQLAESRLDLSRWRLYYGDERCLPPEHPQRNSRMVIDSGLTTRAGAHHPIPAELGPEAGANAYAETLADALPFDLVMLGVGEDGHTASLFPGHAWPEQEPTVPVHNAPKPPPERVSLTPQALRASQRMLVIATGAAKADALQRWRNGEPLPIQRVTDGHPHCLVLTDI